MIRARDRVSTAPARTLTDDDASAPLEEDRMEETAAGTRPGLLDRIPQSQIVTLDVRTELRAGREPFSLIMDACRRVPPGGALMLRAIFEPVPLYQVMARRGFAHWTERRAADDWVVWFYPAPDATAEAAAAAAAAAPDAAVAGASANPASLDGDVVVLDVRGLEPPEPMERTLAALEALPAGTTLVQLNVRVPKFLLPLLEERGFHYEIREQEPGLVRLFIRRSGD